MVEIIYDVGNDVGNGRDTVTQQGQGGPLRL
jgi:hypothetical protein